ncbi:hypothetical protein ACFX14_018982 [Malus domestica]
MTRWNQSQPSLIFLTTRQRFQRESCRARARSKLRRSGSRRFRGATSQSHMRRCHNKDDFLYYQTQQQQHFQKPKLHHSFAYDDGVSEEGSDHEVELPSHPTHSPYSSHNEWERKFTMLLHDKKKQALVTREKKDRCDFEKIAALASRMGLYSHLYLKVAVFSKVPLPNYRFDLDDRRPQSGNETATFFGFLNAAITLVFSCMGVAYGMAKSGMGVVSMGVMRSELVMKSIIPVVMVGVLGIYGLIIVVIISTGINSNAKSYYLFDGYTHLSSGLACGLAGLFAGMATGIVGGAGV